MKQYIWSCQACESENASDVNVCTTCGCPAIVSATEVKQFKRFGKIEVPTKDFDFSGYEVICRREVKAIFVGLYFVALAIKLVITPEISWPNGLGIVICSAWGFHMIYAFVYGHTIYMRGGNLKPGKHKVARYLVLPMGLFLLLMGFGVISGPAK